ncbi:MAG: hypothetical protein GX622_01815, partial [Bacteroidales bacterium]|nr:hypothetical protein [Bacteroidales bacterium]
MRRPDPHTIPSAISLMTLLLLISLMLMPASLCAQRTKEISSHTGDPFLNLEEITLVTDRDIYIAGE